MENYCRYCGRALNNMPCTNPNCIEANRREEYRESGLRRPIPLQERRRQMEESRQRAIAQPRIPVKDNGDTSREKRGGGPFAEEQHASRQVNIEEEREEQDPTTRENDLFSEEPVIRFPSFLSAYYREPGRVVKVAAGKQDAGMGVILILASVCLSLIGTVIFGTVFLDDFLFRWAVAGGLAPLLAYGISLLFGQLYAFLSPVGRERRKNGCGNSAPFREVFTVVTVSAVFPNLLLLLTCVISPLDQTMQIFQSFALLLTLAWILCLMLSLSTVYGGGFSMGGLLLNIGFGLFAFSAMRSVWVWYLTGEFDFALLVPLSVFLTGH